MTRRDLLNTVGNDKGMAREGQPRQTGTDGDDPGPLIAGFKNDLTAGCAARAHGDSFVGKTSQRPILGCSRPTHRLARTAGSIGENPTRVLVYGRTVLTQWLSSMN